MWTYIYICTHNAFVYTHIYASMSREVYNWRGRVVSLPWTCSQYAGKVGPSTTHSDEVFIVRVRRSRNICWMRALFVGEQSGVNVFTVKIRRLLSQLNGGLDQSVDLTAHTVAYLYL